MISPTYLGSIAVVIVSILGLLKMEVSHEEILPIVTGIAGLIILIRRFKKGDLTVLGKVKK